MFSCDHNSGNHPVVRRLDTLVVDDSPTVLASMCRILSGNACIKVVATASDGYEALEMAKLHRPQLVLMDVQMPRMNGITAASLLNHDLPLTEVIIISVHDSPELRALCLKAGARAFITKGRLHQELAPLIITIATDLAAE